jgi:5,10-methenyltetrahydrofolate synthetase
MDRPPPAFTTDISIFLDALQRVNFFISYHALPDEVAIEVVPFLREVLEQKPLIFVPSNKGTDPFELAHKIIKEYPEKQGMIFVPGQKFDAYGTRHGRGGGWYDRFLSKVPTLWIRVGIANQGQFADTPLVRKSWDEPMDWMLYWDDQTFRASETRARHPAS